MKSKIDGVAGVVVLYNPDRTLIDNINSYINQIDYLFIVDNSERPVTFVKDFFETNQTVTYVFNDGNLGVAAALNIGAIRALEKGYSFLLTMDQDSKAPVNLVESLMKVAESEENIGIVSPLHSNKFGTHLKLNKENYEVMSVMTSGNLLSLDAYKKNGGFLDDFFIDYVDVEYCIRLNYNGFKVLRVSDVILEHNEANISQKKLFSKTYYPPNYQPFRLYYKTRNLLYLREIYKRKFPYPLKEEYKIFVMNFLKILLYENHKLLKVRMILMGIWDYLNKKKGRRF